MSQSMHEVLKQTFLCEVTNDNEGYNPQSAIQLWDRHKENLMDAMWKAYDNYLHDHITNPDDKPKTPKTPEEMDEYTLYCTDFSEETWAYEADSLGVPSSAKEVHIYFQLKAYK